jgi:hypothetical protein
VPTTTVAGVSRRHRCIRPALGLAFGFTPHASRTGRDLGVVLLGPLRGPWTVVAGGTWARSAIRPILKTLVSRSASQPPRFARPPPDSPDPIAHLPASCARRRQNILLSVLPPPFCAACWARLPSSPPRAALASSCLAPSAPLSYLSPPPSSTPNIAPHILRVLSYRLYLPATESALIDVGAPPPP